MRFFRYYRAGNIKAFGSPVYVHASVYIFAGIIALSALKSPAMGLIALWSYVGIIFLHEVGHAIIANRLGLSIFRIDIGWFHGRCHYEIPEYEWHEVLVSWGGVTAQLLVSVVVLAIGGLGILESWRYFGPVLIFLGYINLFVAVLNSVPAPRLDGAMMWRIIPLWFAQRKVRKPAKRQLRIVPKDE